MHLVSFDVRASAASTSESIMLCGGAELSVNPRDCAFMSYDTSSVSPDVPRSAAGRGAVQAALLGAQKTQRRGCVLPRSADLNDGLL
eukprot:6212514-Pleurochrysis_carterae.AAC.3